ncbi:MAG: hypothetical protein GXY67_07225 [Clostridiales bacterium]|nr:hypothetical protein [Clostridiales bacterium]
MFFQKDYVLRMIEMMGDLMRRIKELMDDLSRLKLLEDACHRHCGISLDTAEHLTSGSLIDLLPPMPRLMMSEILFVRANTFSLAMEEREELLYKSLRLMASLWSEGPLCELRASRLVELKETLLARLSTEDLMDCARFFCEGEAYGHMEDALFQAVEGMDAGSDRRSALITQGAEMLRKASAATPEALAFSGCTRQELLASALELEAAGQG